MVQAPSHNQPQHGMQLVTLPAPLGPPQMMMAGTINICSHHVQHFKQGCVVCQVAEPASRAAMATTGIKMPEI